MDQHPIPRQITTFEFKLIGFMTIRQFGYVLLGGIFAYGSFLLVPIPLINFVVAIVVFCVGAALAFVPINDRPLDVFLQDLFRRINSPTQYIYKKENAPLSILNELYFEENPHIVLAHVDSREKLNTYLASKISPQQKDGHAERISGLLSEPQAMLGNSHGEIQNGPIAQSKSSLPTSSTEQPKIQTTKHPFFTGIVVNNRHIPLPGVMLYVKEKSTGNVLRILKTNPHGIFATFNPLPDGEYVVEMVDTGNNYHFDPQTISVNNRSKLYFEFSSREVV